MPRILRHHTPARHVACPGALLLSCRARPASRDRSPGRRFDARIFQAEAHRRVAGRAAGPASRHRLGARPGPVRQGGAQFVRLRSRRGRHPGQDLRAGRHRPAGSDLPGRCPHPAGAHRRRHRCGGRLRARARLPRQGRAGDRGRRHVRAAKQSLPDRARQFADQDSGGSQGQAYRGHHRGLAHRLADPRIVAPAGLGQRRHQGRCARRRAGAARRHDARRARRHGDRIRRPASSSRSRARAATSCCSATSRSTSTPM